MSLDLGFVPLAPKFHDVEIHNDEPVPVDFGSEHVGGILHNGYAFHEDYMAVKNEATGTPEVVDVYNATVEDFLFGNDYAEGIMGDHPINVMN